MSIGGRSKDEFWLSRRYCLSQFNKTFITQAMYSDPGVRPRKSHRISSAFQSTSSITLYSLKRDLLSSPIHSESHSLLSRLVCHPENRFRVLWDSLVTLLAAYQAVAIPYILSFELELGAVLLTLEAASVSVFLLDIGTHHTVLTCNTGFYYKGELVLSHCKIVQHYAKFWLWLDILSSVPFSWLQRDISHSALKDSSAFSFSDLVRIAALFRLLRLSHLKHFLVKIEDFAASASLANAFVFIRLLLTLFFSAHWMACWFFYISNRDIDLIHNGWECSLQRTNRCGNAELYVSALYWVFSTMTTVGYGDVIPFTTAQRIHATIIMVGSCGLFAYLLGDIGSLVAKNNAEYAVYRERVVLLNIYMAKNGLPRDFQYRARRFLEYIWAHQSTADLKESDVFSHLSEPLKDEISMQVNGAVLQTCVAFQDYPETVVGKLGMSLQQEAFAPGDEIFQEGLIGSKMYFLREGKVDIYHLATGSSFAILKRKAHFGEIGFFSSLPRCASARCWEFAELLSLDRSHFHTLLTRYPTTFAQSNRVMEQVRKGDLAPLRVHCYLCRELGHVAKGCRKAVIKGNTEELQGKWLIQRSARTKYIGHGGDSLKPNYHRTPRRPLQARHSAKNVLGVRRASVALKQQSPRLYDLAQAYKVSAEPSKRKTPTTYQSSQVPSPESRPLPVPFNSVLFESSSSEEESAPATPSQKVHVALPARESSQESSRLVQTLRKRIGGFSEWTNT